MPRVCAVEKRDLLNYVDSQEVEGCESEMSVEPGVDGQAETSAEQST